MVFGLFLWEKEMLKVIDKKPNLTIIDGSIKTTSLIVAEHFEKQHKHVLESIEKLECSDEFRSAQFSADLYLDSHGREQKCYNLTKNGFMFLVLGFTGKKAAAIREAYINEFDRMEKELAAKRIALQDSRLDSKINKLDSMIKAINKPRKQIKKETKEEKKARERKEFRAWWEQQKINDKKHLINQLKNKL